MAALKTMVYGTPADTGRARSNYRVSIGARTFSVIPPYSPGKDLGIGETANARAALDAARAKLATLRAGQAVYITNNIEYLDLLNNGSSAQSSGGFVEAGIAAARVHIAGTRIFFRDFGITEDLF